MADTPTSVMREALENISEICIEIALHHAGRELDETSQLIVKVFEQMGMYATNSIHKADGLEKNDG